MAKSGAAGGGTPQGTTPMQALAGKFTNTPLMQRMFPQPAQTALPQLNYNNIIFGGGQPGATNIPQRAAFGPPTWDEATQRRAAMQNALTQRPEFQQQQQMRALRAQQEAQQAAQQAADRAAWEKQRSKMELFQGIPYWNQEGGG